MGERESEKKKGRGCFLFFCLAWSIMINTYISGKSLRGYALLENYWGWQRFQLFFSFIHDKSGTFKMISTDSSKKKKYLLESHTFN